jgi:signal transduction histidine kinase/DNA-directed RNA polymerase specialized sigma24 family protein
MDPVISPLRDVRQDAQTSDEHLLPLQTPAMRIGMRIVLLVPLFAAATLVLARRSQVDMGPLGLVFVAVAVSAGLATLLPTERLFRIGWGTPVLFAWSAVNLGLIATGVWAAGGSSSWVMSVYAPTMLFYAVAFSPRAQVILLALTAATYATAVGPSRWSPVNLAALVALAVLSNLLVAQLKHQTAAHREARLESERRWALLAVVSAAAREMSVVEPSIVLQAVVDSVVALGFPTTVIKVREERESRTILPVDPPIDPSREIDSLRFVDLERVLRGTQAVIVDGDAVEQLAACGLSSLVVVPIPVATRVEAILVVGVDQPPVPSAQDVEVFQMLATQAAVALENARRFEDQRRSMERTAELDGMKSDFLSNISHELRTPLTVIAGVGRTLEESSDILPEEERRDLLARLNANAATLDNMVSELLDFGRLETGQLYLAPVDFDLGELLHAVTDRLASLFREHTVEVDVEDGLIANADPLLIERVLENLLTNAAKYSPAGSRVRVSGTTQGQEVVVAVGDDGPGIPPDELEHIGERFFRGGDVNTRSTRGTGLGLALISEILDLHATYLEVESELGAGSTFRFRLLRAGEIGQSSIVGETTISDASPSVQSLAVSDVGLPDRFETVLAAAQMGLEWSVAALFREFHPRVLRYLRAHVPDLAEQLASETWGEIASALPAFEGDEASFRRWVFAVARRRQQEAREKSPRPSTHAFEGYDAISAERRAVDAALERIGALGPDQADVFLLRVVGNLDPVEVAEITGEPADVVRATEREALRGLTHREAEVRDLQRAGSG